MIGDAGLKSAHRSAHEYSPRGIYNLENWKYISGMEREAKISSNMNNDTFTVPPAHIDASYPEQNTVVARNDMKSKDTSSISHPVTESTIMKN